MFTESSLAQQLITSQSYSESNGLFMLSSVLLWVMSKPGMKKKKDLVEFKRVLDR